jgi:alpha-L-rhamnosidase
MEMIAVLQEAYPMMKRYMAYLQTKADNYILSHGLGDWYDLGPKHPGEAQLTPKPVTATSIWYYDLQIIAKVAEMIGHNEDSKQFENLSAQVKEAFLKSFYDEQTGVCATGSQTSYAMSLYTGLIPESDKEKVLTNLIDSIAKNDFALTSGDIGYHFLVRDFK